MHGNKIHCTLCSYPNYSLHTLECPLSIVHKYAVCSMMTLNQICLQKSRYSVAVWHPGCTTVSQVRSIVLVMQYDGYHSGKRISLCLETERTKNMAPPDTAVLLVKLVLWMSSIITFCLKHKKSSPSISIEIRNDLNIMPPQDFANSATNTVHSPISICDTEMAHQLIPIISADVSTNTSTGWQNGRWRNHSCFLASWASQHAQWTGYCFACISHWYFHITRSATVILCFMINGKKPHWSLTIGIWQQCGRPVMGSATQYQTVT